MFSSEVFEKVKITAPTEALACIARLWRLWIYRRRLWCHSE